MSAGSRKPEARRVDAAVANAQRQTYAIPADGITFLNAGRCVSQLARVSRIRDVIFESFGVKHGG